MASAGPRRRAARAAGARLAPRQYRPREGRKVTARAARAVNACQKLKRRGRREGSAAPACARRGAAATPGAGRIEDDRASASQMVWTQTLLTRREQVGRAEGRWWKYVEGRAHSGAPVRAARRRPGPRALALRGQSGAPAFPPLISVFVERDKERPPRLPLRQTGARFFRVERNSLMTRRGRGGSPAAEDGHGAAAPSGSWPSQGEHGRTKSAVVGS